MTPPAEERRSVARLVGPFGSSVAVRRAAGRVRSAALAEDLGPRAVRLRYRGEIAEGERVFAIVRLSITDVGPAPGVAILGRAARVDVRPDDSTTVVVLADKVRWLYTGRGQRASDGRELPEATEV